MEIQNRKQAIPLIMVCEHNGCKETKGLDYIRKDKIAGWEDEPIYLCLEHSKGFKIYKK